MKKSYLNFSVLEREKRERERERETKIGRLFQFFFIAPFCQLENENIPTRKQLN